MSTGITYMHTCNLQTKVVEHSWRTYELIPYNDHLTQRDKTHVVTCEATGSHFLESHIASCCVTRQGDTRVRVGVIGIGRTVCVRHVVI